MGGYGEEEMYLHWTVTEAARLVSNRLRGCCWAVSGGPEKRKDN